MGRGPWTVDCGLLLILILGPWIGGLHAGRIGEGNGPGYYNLKLGSEAAADKGKRGFKVGREDEGIIQSSFLKLQYCKPDNVGFLFFVTLQDLTRASR